MMNQGDISTVCTILYKIEKNMKRGNLRAITQDLERVETAKGKTIIQSMINVEERLRNSFIPDVQLEFTQYLTAFLASEVRQLLKHNAPYREINHLIRTYY